MELIELTAEAQPRTRGADPKFYIRAFYQNCNRGCPNNLDFIEHRTYGDAVPN